MPQRALDNRGLEPPMPMVRTLEALEAMSDGDVLTIHNDRVPVYLLPQLEELGASYQVESLPDGSARVRIVKGAAGAAP
ncbi:MAG: DUF2249 domain-containing protein [Deinococcales bacterium]|jgi:tRNA 2-thiouridine synthesizing protein A